MIQKRRVQSIVFIAVLVMVFSLSICKLVHSQTNHVEAAMDETRIGYLSIPIKANDTLTSIADEYYTDEFGSKQSYIELMKEYNCLKTDTIYSGNYLIVPVYK